MRIVHYGLRINAMHALKSACVAVRQATNDAVDFDVIAGMVPKVESAPHANILIVDLEHIPIADSISLIRQSSTANPFLRTIIIAATFAAPHEHTRLFELGQLPRTELLDGHGAKAAHTWESIVDDTLGLLALRAFDHALRLLIPADGRGRIVLAMAKHPHASSVKELVGRMYTEHELSTDSKRHRLWVDCNRVGLRSPEDILDALRLLLLKTMLDHAQWSNKRIAAYMGFNCVRNMTRSCGGRYGYSVTGLQIVNAGIIHLKVGNVFWDGTSVRLSTVPVPQFNEGGLIYN